MNRTRPISYHWSLVYFTMCGQPESSSFIIYLDLRISVVDQISGNADEKRIVCYYTNWSVYRPGTAKFSPQNINPYLCTHLIYAFGGFTKENTLKPFDKYQDIEKGKTDYLKESNELKKKSFFF